MRGNQARGLPTLRSKISDPHVHDAWAGNAPYSGLVRAAWSRWAADGGPSGSGLAMGSWKRC